MLRRLTLMTNNLRIRLQIVRERFIQLWDWLGTVDYHVRVAATIDVTATFIGIGLTWLTGSNTYAQIAFVPVIFCWIYIARITAVNLWLAELGVTVADRVVGTVDSWWDRLRDRAPWWISWTLGSRSGAPRSTGPVATVSGAHHGQPGQAIWHDTSLGGHLFHVLSTIWMWAHTPLYAAGFLPVWIAGVLPAMIMLTAMIIFFVATEDFVNIREWRRRLAYFVTVHVVIFLVLVLGRMFAPGTYDYLISRYEHSQTLDEQKADGIDARADYNRFWQEKLDAEILDLENKKRWNTVDPAQFGWTAEDQRQLNSRVQVRSQLRAEPQGKEMRMTRLADPKVAIPAGFLLGVLGIVVLIATKR